MRAALRRLVRRYPLLGRAFAALPIGLTGGGAARSAAEYWEHRYAQGGDSGGGSYGELAAFKARFLNALIAEHAIRSAIEFGCGDGNQLGLVDYPHYTGLDVSQSAVERCRERYADDANKRFAVYRPNAFDPQDGSLRAEAALSLDVLYHLVEDSVFALHIEHLFGAAERFVVIYSSDVDRPVSPHVRHRRFSEHVARTQPGWSLAGRESNPLAKQAVGEAGSDAEFFVYARSAAP